VFYIVPMAALINIIQWTYGVKLITGEKAAVSWRNIVFSPLIISCCIGLTLFFTGLGARMPVLLTNVLSGLSAINGPLAMIIVGVYMAQTKLRPMLSTPSLYALSAVRLLLIPAVMLPVCLLLPAAQDIKMTLMICSAAPVGINVAVYSQLFGRDYGYACRSIALCTIFSIVTMPLVVVVTEWLL